MAVVTQEYGGQYYSWWWVSQPCRIRLNGAWSVLEASWCFYKITDNDQVPVYFRFTQTNQTTHYSIYIFKRDRGYAFFETRNSISIRQHALVIVSKCCTLSSYPHFEVKARPMLPQQVRCFILRVIAS